MPTEKITIGNVEIIAFSDGHLQFAPDGFFPTIALEDWEPYKDHFTSDGKIKLNMGSFLLRSEGKTILVDTGLGPSAEGFEGAVSGLLPNAIINGGIALEDVDMVVITHLHRDHVGWNFTQGDEGFKPTFPNARYYVPKADWDIYTKRAGMSAFSYIKEQVTPLQDLGVLELIEGEQSLTSDLSALPTPGHTPGHTSYLVASRGERAIILGDAIHTQAQLQRTDWSPRADIDADQSSKTRSALVERIESENSYVASGHFPAPGFGRIVRVEGRRYWQAT